MGDCQNGKGGREEAGSRHGEDSATWRKRVKGMRWKQSGWKSDSRAQRRELEWRLGRGG